MKIGFGGFRVGTLAKSFLYAASFCCSAAGVLGDGAQNSAVKTPQQFFAYRSFMPEWDTMKKFRKIGIDTFTLMFSNGYNMLGTPYTKYQPIWIRDGAYDMDMVDRQFDDLIAAVPDAKVICFIDLNPPTWWVKRMGFQMRKGDSFMESGMVYGSDIWRTDVADYFRAMLKHISAKYGDRVVAYIYGAGPTTEWFDRSLGFESPSRIVGWRKWNYERGKPIPADLPTFTQRYSGDADTTPVKVSKEELFKDYTGIFKYIVADGLIRTPEKNQTAIDFWHFSNQTTADTVLYMAKVAREIIPRNVPLGTMFGYTVYNGRLWFASAGHLDYERVFDSPDIDMINAPTCYIDRAMGGGSGSMIPVMSLHLRGKRMLDTCDHRTFTSRIPKYTPGSDQPWKNGAEVAAGIKREVAYKLINGTSTWWFDMWGGWWDSPEAMETIAKSKKIFDVEGNKPFDDSAYQVLRVVDPENMYYVNDIRADAEMFTGRLKVKMNRIPAPYGTCSFNDLDKLDLSNVRLLIMTCPFNLDGDKMKILRDKVLKDGRSVLWFYGPGVIKDGKWNTENVEKVCGVKFKTAGINKADMGGWSSIYVADPRTLTVESLRKIYEGSGVRLWADKPLPVFANRTLAAIHTGTATEVELKFPKKCALIEELYTGEKFENTDTVKIKTLGPDTKLYRYE